MLDTSPERGDFKDRIASLTDLDKGKSPEWKSSSACGEGGTGE
jgi:hypothetical protein